MHTHEEYYGVLNWQGPAYFLEKGMVLPPERSSQIGWPILVSADKPERGGCTFGPKVLTDHMTYGLIDVPQSVVQAPNGAFLKRPVDVVEQLSKNARYSIHHVMNTADVVQLERIDNIWWRDPRVLQLMNSAYKQAKLNGWKMSKHTADEELQVDVVKAASGAGGVSTPGSANDAHAMLKQKGAEPKWPKRKTRPPRKRYITATKRRSLLTKPRWRTPKRW